MQPVDRGVFEAQFYGLTQGSLFDFSLGWHQEWGTKQPSATEWKGSPGGWPWPWVSIKKPQVLMEVWYIRSWYPIRLSELPEISLLP